MTVVSVKKDMRCEDHKLEIPKSVKRIIQAPFPFFVDAKFLSNTRAEDERIVSRPDKCKPTVTCLVEMLAAVSVNAT